MKKTFKKMAALLMAVAMVITSMSFTAFAATADQSVTIKGVKSGTVTLYKVVSEEKNAWKPISVENDGTTYTINDPEHPTLKEITDLATMADKGKISAVANSTKPATGSDLVWTGLAPGMYLAIVTGATSEVYNPMIVSVDYENDAEVADAGLGYDKIDGVVIAKKGEPDLKKIISDGRENGTAQQGDTAYAGDTISYLINTTIPSWSDEYQDPKFIFEDTLVNGFEGYVAGSLHVYEGKYETAAAITADTNKKEITSFNSNTFPTASGTKTFALDFKVETNKAARPITIVYQAKIDKVDYAKGFDPNDNEAKIKYSNNPKNNKDQKEKKDKTYNYTFGIDGELNGLQGEKDKWTDEVVKVDENGKITPIASNEYESDEKFTEIDGTALNGAVFGLFTDENCNTPYKDANGANVTATSGKIGEANGKINFNGLDAGTYYMKELSAPAGYGVNPTIIQIEIAAEFYPAGDDNEGKLKSYTVKMGKKGEALNQTKYTATYTGDTKVVKRDGASTTTFIQNDKVGGLPSTGGMGTIIFTVAGIAIMAIAAGLLIAKKASK